jgi:tetratricopeptide (TPR) repeat protein
MKRRLGTSVFLVSVLAVGCGGGTPPGTKSASEVQASKMGDTFAGQNRCSPKSHERPFIIEWDGTDMSSFEARAANDVVFVRYQGCDLIVMDSCSSDSVRGSLGSYKPVDWTSGSLESIDVANEGELYAKLPLGAATLGGRVRGGEKFHMEYFVSGTRSATRDTIHRADLAKTPGCKNATHFVYAYNLGAFALGAQSNLHAEAGGTVGVFGGGGSHSSQSKAEKRGGDIAACKGESGKEQQACKSPIRLTLREISADESADARDANATDTPDAKNLAGRLQASTDREKQALERARSAETKLGARDGKSCLAELDEHDKLDPRPSGMSTNAVSQLASVRGRCLMLAGQCPVGKDVFRKALEKAGGTTGPADLDRKTDEAATQYCQGGTMSPRDQYLKAGTDLEVAAYKERKDVAYCMAAYNVAKRLVSTVKPKDEDDPVKFVFANVRTNAPKCLARAKDCAAALTVYKEAWKLDPLMPEASRNLNEQALRVGFDAVIGGNDTCPKTAAKAEWEKMLEKKK